MQIAFLAWTGGMLARVDLTCLGRRTGKTGSRTAFHCYDFLIARLLTFSGVIVLKMQIESLLGKEYVDV